MHFSKVYSAQTALLKAHIVTIEVDITKGSLHAFTIVGLPDKAVEESRDRMSAAIKNSGFVSPKGKNQKIVISLALEWILSLKGLKSIFLKWIFRASHFKVNMRPSGLTG